LDGTLSEEKVVSVVGRAGLLDVAPSIKKAATAVRDDDYDSDAEEKGRMARYRNLIAKKREEDLSDMTNMLGGLSCFGSSTPTGSVASSVASSPFGTQPAKEPFLTAVLLAAGARRKRASRRE
jgi:hypothetical protein